MRSNPAGAFIIYTFPKNFKTFLGANIVHHIGLNIFDMIFLALTYFGHVVKKEIQIVC